MEATTKGTPPELKALKEQMDNLRKKIEEDAEKIEAARKAREATERDLEEAKKQLAAAKSAPETSPAPAPTATPKSEKKPEAPKAPAKKISSKEYQEMIELKTTNAKVAIVAGGNTHMANILRAEAAELQKVLDARNEKIAAINTKMEEAKNSYMEKIKLMEENNKLVGGTGTARVGKVTFGPKIQKEIDEKLAPFLEEISRIESGEDDLSSATSAEEVAPEKVVESEKTLDENNIDALKAQIEELKKEILDAVQIAVVAEEAERKSLHEKADRLKEEVKRLEARVRELENNPTPLAEVKSEETAKEDEVTEKEEAEIPAVEVAFPEGVLNTEEEKNKTPEKSKEALLEEARDAYAKEYGKYISQKLGRGDRIRRMLGMEVKNRPPMPEALVALKQNYDSALYAHANELYEQKKEELKNDPDAEEKLGKYASETIAPKLIIEEFGKLKGLQEQNMTKKERGAVRRLMERFSKWPWYVRRPIAMAAFAGISAGVLAAAGVAPVAVLGIVGTRLGRSAAGAIVGETAAWAVGGRKGIEARLKNGTEESKKLLQTLNWDEQAFITTRNNYLNRLSQYDKEMSNSRRRQMVARILVGGGTVTALSLTDALSLGGNTPELPKAPTPEPDIMKPDQFKVSSLGAIDSMKQLKEHLATQFPNPETAPAHIKHILQTDATALTKEFGLWDGTKSALNDARSTISMDSKGNIVLNDYGKGSTVLSGNGAEKYSGRMFEFGGGESTIDTDIEVEGEETTIPEDLGGTTTGVDQNAINARTAYQQYASTRTPGSTLMNPNQQGTLTNPNQNAPFNNNPLYQTNNTPRQSRWRDFFSLFGRRSGGGGNLPTSERDSWFN